MMDVKCTQRNTDEGTCIQKLEFVSNIPFIVVSGKVIAAGNF